MKHPDGVVVPANSDPRPTSGASVGLLHGASEGPQLELQARQRATALRALSDVSFQLQSTLDLAVVLDEICASFCAVARCERAAIAELARDGALRAVAARNLVAEELATLARPGIETDLAREAIATRALVVGEADRLQSQIAPEVLESLNVRGPLACIALFAADEPVGLVFFDRMGGDLALTVEDAGHCETLANLAGLAIQRGRLHRAAQEAARLEERARIAQDLHDSVAQAIFRAGIELRRFSEKWPQHAEALRCARENVSDAGARLRDAINSEGVGTLPTVVMEERVRVLATAFAARTGCSCVVRVDLPAEPADGLATLLERFVAEGLVNVEKHSGASKASIEVRYLRGRLSAAIDDDGRGLVDGPARGGRSNQFGLRWLRAETRRWGGTIRLGRSSLGGSQLRLSAPWVAHAGVE